MNSGWTGCDRREQRRGPAPLLLALGATLVAAALP